MFDEKIAHGTPFRRAIEDGLIDGNPVAQIGLRGAGYTAEDFDCQSHGIRVVQVEEWWCKSVSPIMDEVRTKLGKVPVYLTFDIDGLDPSFAPGTGTPEIGGLMIWQALEIIRGLPWAGYRGLRPCGDFAAVRPARHYGTGRREPAV